MNDFVDFHEVEIEDVIVRLFVQSFGGKVLKLFRALPATSITTLPILQRQFLDQREVKNNPVLILPEYENIKRNVCESVQDYCVRFNVVYNDIPTNIKPPKGLALLKFPDGFDADTAYELCEQDPTAPEDMQKNVVSVEANLLAKRERMRSNKTVTMKEEASTLDVKMDTLIQMMERMVYRFSITDKPTPQIRNPNFRGQQPPQF